MVDVSGKKSFDISVNTGRICIVFEADKLENSKTCPSSKTYQ